MDQVWERYAHHFPVREKLIYLNHAAVAPLSRDAAEAMKHLSDDAANFGSLHYDQWMATYEGVRSAAAGLINASPREIALVKNTSEGIATIAMGMKWEPGDIVVAFLEEFPANYFPWKRLESQGVEVRWLSVFDDLQRIDEACHGAKLLAISYVQFLSGYRVDIDAIGEICARHGCFYFLDAIQGLGIFPIDVKKARIDALAADGHKWLLGPEGCGVLFVREAVQDRIEPVEFGWTNVAYYSDYASRDMTLRADAGRYECGTLNTIGCYGLRASIELILSIGVDNITPAVQARADQIYAGARALGFETLGPDRTPLNGAGIVAFRKPGAETHVIVRRLKESGIAVAPRQGWVRASPHFYISPADIEKLLEELRQW